MKEEIKVGDIIETCGLYPGVVMEIDGDDIKVRRLDIEEYDNESDFMSCSLSNCGPVKITITQAIRRIQLGNEILKVLWEVSKNQEEYTKLVDSTCDFGILSTQ